MIICSLYLKVDVCKDVLHGASVLEDRVVDRRQLLNVVLVDLSISSLVTEGRYHLIYDVMQPQYVRVRFEILPIISVTTFSYLIENRVLPLLTYVIFQK